MPEGVEHNPYERKQKERRQVNTYLMPEGVEHVSGLYLETLNAGVNTYLMPEGVEHLFLSPGLVTLSCEYLSDAGRR